MLYKICIQGAVNQFLLYKICIQLATKYFQQSIQYQHCPVHLVEAESFYLR